MLAALPLASSYESLFPESNGADRKSRDRRFDGSPLTYQRSSDQRSPRLHRSVSFIPVNPTDSVTAQSHFIETDVPDSGLSIRQCQAQKESLRNRVPMDLIEKASHNLQVVSHRLPIGISSHVVLRRPLRQGSISVRDNDHHRPRPPSSTHSQQEVSC